MDTLIPDSLLKLRDAASALAMDVLLPAAEAVDADARWPAEAMQALHEERLTGLTVPKAFGGLGQGLLGLATITETLGRACASTAMCYGMHCVGAAVIAAKNSAEQGARYLEPIAAGKHLTTLALSESGSGAHFFLPQTSLTATGDTFLLNGTKQFVTNGGHADSYVVSTVASQSSSHGDFSCVVLDSDTPDLAWGDAWNGVGMRGNASRSLTLRNTRVPLRNLLGADGDQAWYVFEVVAPYFLTAMAGTYLGVSQAALDIAVAHLRSRRHAHSGQALGDIDLLQHRVGQMWTAVARSRLLLQHAAVGGDLGRPEALTAILACKADAANAAVWVTNEAMTLCGGMAYRENSTLSRLLRDARASHVMSPTTDLLTTWTGRSVLGMPLL